MAEDNICARAERTLRRFDLGVRRIDVDLLGSDPLNRGGLPPSGKHVHGLWKNILERQTFQRHRYGNIIALDHDPGQPHRVQQFCQAWAKKESGLLPPPSGRELYGVLVHQHLIYGAKCLKHGGILWDSSPTERMTVPAGEKHEALREHLDQGFYVQLLDHKALLEDPEGLKAIVQSFNLDQALAMADHEVSLLHQLVSLVRTIQIPAGRQLEDVILEQVRTTCGGRWDDEDSRCLYNLSLVIDPGHCQLLVDMHFQYVNPAVLLVRPSWFDKLAKFIPKDYPLVKICCAMQQYMSKPDQMCRTGRQLVAQGFPESRLKQFADDDMQGLLQHLEKAASEVAARYNEHTCPHASASVLLKVRTQYLTRLGAMARDTKTYSEADCAAACALLESKLRQGLLKEDSSAALPAPVHDAAATEESQKEVQQYKRSAPDLQLNEPLEFGSAGIVKTPALAAAAVEIFPGTLVALTAACGKLARGTKATVIGFTPSKARLKAESGYEFEAFVKSLEASSEEPKAKERKRIKAAEPAAGEAPLPGRALEWQLRSAADEETGLRHQIGSALWQLYVTCGVTGGPEVLEICRTLAEDEKSAKWTVLAKKDICAGSLHLTPHSADIVSQATVSRVRAVCKGWVPVPATTLQLHVPNAAPTDFTLGAPSALAAPVAPSEVAPFWLIAEAPGEEGNVMMCTRTLQCGIASGTFTQKRFQLSSKGAMRMEVQYLTNPEAIKAGDTLLTRQK